MDQIAILVADDTALLRRLLVERLGREGDIKIVAEAEDGQAAVDLARTTCPDVVILDLDMPGLNGVQAAQQIVADLPSVGVVLLTAHEQLAALGRLSGASECMDKRCTPQEIAAAVRRAATSARAASPLPPAPASTPVSAERAAAPSMAALIDRLAGPAALTERERAVVEKMVATELTAGQIARALGAEFGRSMSESAIKHALERALNKMQIEPRTRAALIRRVLDVGSDSAATANTATV